MFQDRKRKMRPRLREGSLSLVTRKRRCKFCIAKQDKIDYKDVNRLLQFLSERGKMVSRRLSGNCSKHQRRLASAIRCARFLALFPTK